MAIGKLHIGSAGFDFNKAGCDLLNSNNLEDAIKSKTITDYCTSLEDLSLKIDDIPFLLNNVQEINFLDQDNYLDPEKNSNESLGVICYHLLNEFRNTIKIEKEINEKLFRYWIETVIMQDRLFDRPQGKTLWVAGCSFSSAVGVAPEERWSNLVAESIGFIEVNMAQGGGSIYDASDHIIRADLQKGDIVVWGLTSLDRVDLLVNARLKGITAVQAISDENCREYFNINWVGSNTQRVVALKQIYQVIAHCKKIGVELYLINLIDNDWLPKVLCQKTNFIDLHVKEMPKMFIDLGSDNLHPGPLQHQSYAKEIIKFIQGS